MLRSTRHGFGLWGWLAALLLRAAVPVGAAGADEPLTFEQHVRPILKAHCFHCHGEEAKVRGNLDLRFVRAMVRGGDLGSAVEPGSREDSLLWTRVEADEMPPVDKKLSAREKATLASWIDQGARTIRPEPDQDLPPGPVLTDEERSFWSFQPIRHPEPPRPHASDRVANPIDAFLLKSLEAGGLSFGEVADRLTLIRRATFDLTGLPPTPEEVEAFQNDPGPEAYERLIDRLLASPRLGERWARHWLDVAGYADSDGVGPKDEVRPYAYKYRDYLVRAINDDRPWDALLVEQLAGDELLEPAQSYSTAANLDRLVATGFLRMAPDGTADKDADAVASRNEVLADTLKIVTTSVLGLTVGCAQCHAHRYDPIAHEDYFRLRAIFEPALDPQHWKTPQQRLVSLWTPEQQAKAAEVDAQVKTIRDEQNAEMSRLVECVLEKELEAAPEELRTRLREARDVPKGKRTAEQESLLKEHPRVLVNTGNVSLYDAKAHRAITADFAKRISAAQAARPPEDYAHSLKEVPGQVPTTHRFERGDPNQPREAVEPGELSVIAATVGAAPIPSRDPERRTTGRRLAYARHLTSGRHPLVTRVLVNRFWMHLFGRGIVATPGDFGALGERPTHPELLDWLADQFVRDGWSLKVFLRRAMTTTAYRQSSRRRPELDTADPENRLLGRMPVRRLEAEALRDAILAVSGRLNPTLYGTPVPVSVDDASQVVVGIIPRDDAGRPSGKRQDIGQEEFRRSLYVQVRRSLPLGLTEAFDAPVPTPNCEKRSVSTVAPQSLLLMNNDFVIEQSLVFAARVEGESGDEPAARVRRAWRLALGTEPNAEKLSTAIAFLDAQGADFAATDASRSEEARKKAPAPPPARRALATLGQALLGSNAFLYLD